MKCVSYTRTLPWKNHQGELTIAEQNQRIAAYLAEHKELDLQKKYSDRKGAENASVAFDKMTDDGVERKFDCIIVASVYYCGPDFPAARQAIKETLYATGIDLIVLDEGLDTRTASRKEVEDYFEAKRCEMHAEIMFAWRRKQGAGFRLTSSVPFGYIRRNGESNMIKDEEVAPYLSEAFSRYASGQKMRDIAKWLNEQGVEPPMRHKKRILGKPYDAESDQWTTDMLRCLFRNPTYTGAAANGSRQIIAENCHEPYITKEQFYHCSAWFFYLLGSVLLATAILSYLMHQSQGMEALQMLIGGFAIFMIPQVVGGVVVLLELAAVMLRQIWYI